MSDPHCFDVCNGDADGLCAVFQWRLHAPHAAKLVTGLAGEIALLERVHAAAGDRVSVCDISTARLYGVLSAYSDPLELWAKETVGQGLDALRQPDRRHAAELQPYWQDDNAAVYLLPDEPWSRRVSGGPASELERFVQAFGAARWGAH